MAFTSGTAALFKGIDIRERRKFKSPVKADKDANAKIQLEKRAKKEQEDE